VHLSEFGEIFKVPAMRAADGLFSRCLKDDDFAFDSTSVDIEFELKSSSAL
jgi:hypothetical protein